MAQDETAERGIVRVIVTRTDEPLRSDPRKPMTAREWARFGGLRKLPKPPRFVPQDDATADRPQGWHYTWTAT